ncbi:family 10 glycosylhydrolase [Acholeplasma laidlawii]|uniref:family 10 glycosylhydrolase n=1 Tax=Acholeplasma laidlawii TaxID=2148 RepID=UPI002540D5EC|nr:family 10 glycosylhydrolase [Acholeplasma laidlawii]
MKKVILLLLTLVLTLTLIPTNETHAYPEPEILTSPGEFRATWITHFIGSMPAYSTEQNFKSEVNSILNNMEANNLNVAIVHLRTHNNALYKSEINPVASWFATVDFDVFDPMAYFIEEAHKRGIEFHAWLNPYRVLSIYQRGTIPASNPQSNPANLLSNKEGTAHILNPALPVVREHVVNTILEIIENYNVDAIHFDDYFYMDMKNGSILNDPDQALFLSDPLGQPNTAVGKANWRRAQINTFIEQASEAIKDFNQANDRYVQFGISPTGIYRNGDGIVTYDQDGKPITNGSNTLGQEHYASYLFADTVHWISEGWLDYILPQSYWASTHSLAAFDKVMGWWDKVVRYLDVNLYSGIGLYLADAGSASNVYSWRDNPEEFSNQMEFLHSLESNKGFSIYSYNMVRDAGLNYGRPSQANLFNARDDYFSTKTVLPPLKSMTPVYLPAVSNILHNPSNGTLTFDGHPEAKFYYIYKSSNPLTYEDPEIIDIISNDGNSTITWSSNDTTSSNYYGVRSISYTNHLSPAFESSVDAPLHTFNGVYDGVRFTSQVDLEFSSAHDIYYSLDGSTWESYSTPIRIISNGLNIIHYKALDTLGNESMTQVLTFYTDIKNEVLPTININGTTSGTSYLLGTQIEIESSDHDIWVKINHGAEGTWELYEGPITLTSRGNYAIYSKTIDAGGVESVEVQRNLSIVSAYSNPSVVLEGSGTNPNYESVQVTFSFDPNAPEPQYRINDGLWQYYTGPVLFDQIGNYTITYRNGLIEPIFTRTFNIIEVLDEPTLEITGDGVDPNYDWLEITINFDPNAPEPRYRMNGGSWIQYLEPILFEQVGHYTIEYRNGPLEPIYNKVFNIVEGPGEVTVGIEGNLVDDTYIGPVTVTLTPDNSADTIEYRLYNGQNWTTWFNYTSPITLSTTARHRVKYRVTSMSGIVSEEVEVKIKVDIPITEDNPFVVRNGQNVYYYQTNTPVALPTTYTEKDKEIRAVWVATVANIDISQYDNEENYKKQIIDILERMKELKFNTMFFQTRPMNDSFYPSEYAPMSRFLSGTEGVGVGWDVLEFLIKEAHVRGIEVHAWMNPYRVASGSTASIGDQLALLHDSNFAKQNPSYVVQDKNGALILNPGIPEVREYLYNIVDELMENYAIDGVHFDDYFYSYSGTEDSQDADAFLNYNPNNLSLDDWRRENVNMFVKNIFERVEAHNKDNNMHVKFGISPFGIWRNKTQDALGSNSQGLSSYSAQYADSRKWVKEGWLHYIIPQLYWQFDHSTARFADLVDWWVDVVKDTNVDLIIGQGFYRYAENSNNWTNESEFLEQLRYMSQYDEIIGSSIFSYKTLNSNHRLVNAALTRLGNHYWTKNVEHTWETHMNDVEPTPEPTPVNFDITIFLSAISTFVVLLGVVIFIVVKKKR